MGSIARELLLSAQILQYCKNLNNASGIANQNFFIKMKSGKIYEVEKGYIVYCGNKKVSITENLIVEPDSKDGILAAFAKIAIISATSDKKEIKYKKIKKVYA